MIPSLAGILACIAVALAGCLWGSATLVGLPAALAFGATAFATLPALGGSSPQIYTIFAMSLVVAPFLRPGGIATLASGVRRTPVSLVLVVMIVHASATAMILPRLFAGETSVFVPSRQTGEIMETVLAPVSGNISQTAYFVLGALTCLVLCATLPTGGRLALIRRGLMLWATLNAGLGAIDLLAKLGGAGDVLEFIRTASYAMATDVEHAGFFRIAGGHSEASAFGSAIFASMVFCMTWARMTGDRRVGLLAAASLGLLLLSTSTTAYACLAIYGAGLAGLALLNLLRGRVRKADLALLYAVLAGAAIVLAIHLYNNNAFDAVRKLLDAAIFNKASSSSAAERGYWNMRSFETFLETGGLGVGMGSSRASNWLIAALSQTGAVGVALQLLLSLALLRPLPQNRPHDPQLRALHEAARATGLASITAMMLNGSSADPGMLFFICVAVTLSSRRVLLAQPGAWPTARALSWRPPVPPGQLPPTQLAHDHG